MYRRDGHPMPHREEGSVYFRPESVNDDPRVLGLQPGLLTHGFTGMGQEAADPTTISEVEIQGSPMGDMPFYDSEVWRLFSLAGAGIGAYHGYKRNNSVWWAIGWALLGSIVPIVVIPVAFAQGIGKPKGRS